MKKTIFFILCILISSQVLSKPTVDIQQILKDNSGNILTPERVKNGIPQIQSNEFPISWRQISYGQYKNKKHYRYLFLKSEESRTFYQLEVDGSLEEGYEFFIEKGLEYTISNGKIDMDVGMRNGCMFVLGKCKYPFLSDFEVLRTSFKNGIWTNTYSTRAGSGVITTVYDKYGLLIYRHSIIKNSTRHFESEIFKETSL